MRTHWTRRELARAALGATIAGGGTMWKEGSARGQTMIGATILLSDSASDTVTFLDVPGGTVQSVQVGAAPWGIARKDERAFVATAEGVAVVELEERRRTALISYESQPAEIGWGEYRAGGMGIAVSPTADLVFVGNYLSDGTSRLEILDWRGASVVASAPVGVRPFDVLASQDGLDAYSIDHDSYTVTVVSVETLAARTLPVSPLGDALGLAGFEKPHYGVLDGDGRILMPFQGQVLARLDPVSGTYESIPLEANTHQHGIAISRDGARLLIVGTEPAGDATEGASLTIMEIDSGEEKLVPLGRPHERVAFSADERAAFLTGGYTFAGGGWDGITVVDLESFTTVEIAAGAWPLDISVIP